MSMLEFMIALAITVLGSRLFSRFQGETPRSQTMKKWLVYFAGVFFLTFAVGQPWSLVWTLLPMLGLLVHFVWCHRHGIHPVTAEPRDRYYTLRGWNTPTEHNH